MHFSSNVNTEFEQLRSKWNPSLVQDYKDALDLVHISDLNEKIEAVDLESVTQIQVDLLTKDLCELYIRPAKALSMCKPGGKFVRGSKRQQVNANKPWFNRECIAERQEYFRVKNRLKRVKTDEAKAELKARSREYKKFIRKSIKTYNKDFHKKLRNLKNSKPKEYWGLLNVY